MASGWAREGAVQEQIDNTIDDAVAWARRDLEHAGQSRSHCIECEEPVPEKRRELIPGVQRCVACQSEADKRQQEQAGFNRRGSKDSQLR